MIVNTGKSKDNSWRGLKRGQQTDPRGGARLGLSGNCLEGRQNVTGLHLAWSTWALNKFEAGSLS